MSIPLLKFYQGLRSRYEAHHKVKINHEALVASAKLSDRYIPDRFLPDKAIDVIDETGSRIKLKRLTPSTELKELEITDKQTC